MKTVGIICEYNPFHKGHLRQIELIRSQFGEDHAIVCVMSGNYVQRGTPAMWDKFTRARAALACGADVVLELPITAVLQSAEGFATAGVEILTRMGCVDHLCFGVEQGDAETYLALAAQMDTDDFSKKLRIELDKGISYAAARQNALGVDGEFLTTPNNILGLEYCRAIIRSGTSLSPMTVIRNGNYHDPLPRSDAPSATAVRVIFPHGPWAEYVPAEAAAVFENTPWYDLQFGERAVLARLRTLDDEQWEAVAHGSEGLWRKAMKAARTRDTLEDIISETKSKRYPRTRIQRLLLCAYLGITADDLALTIPHVRVLALSCAGRTLLRQAKDHDKLTILNPGQAPQDRYYAELEQRASRLFTLFAAPGYSMSAQLEDHGRIILK